MTKQNEPNPNHKQLEPDQTLKIVEVNGLTVTVEDADGDFITFDIDLRGLPHSYGGSTSEI